MNFSVLQYFITVAECLNFSKAAELLHVSQPTLSRQIAILEEELCMPLFNRTKPNIQLTLAGEVCLEKSRNILNQYKNMCNTIVEIKKGNIGSISIGYVNLSQFRIMTNAIDYVHKNHPDIQLNVTQLSLPEIQTAILQRKIDIGFDMRVNVNEPGDICYKKITDSKLYAVVSGRHKFSKRESISLSELDREKLVIFERKQAPNLFDSVVSLCSKLGFTPNFSAYGKDMESVLMMAGLGQGIALMDHTAKILETEHTIFVPINDCKMSYDWYLSWHKDNDNPCLLIVIDSIYNNQLFN